MKDKELKLVEQIKVTKEIGITVADLMPLFGTKNPADIHSRIYRARRHGFEIISKHVGRNVVYYIGVAPDEIGVSSTTTFVSREAKSLKKTDEFYISATSAKKTSRKLYYRPEVVGKTLIIHTNAKEVRISK